PVDVPDRVGDVALLQLNAPGPDVVGHSGHGREVRRADLPGHVARRSAERRVGALDDVAAEGAQGQRFELVADEVGLEAVHGFEIHALHLGGRDVEAHVPDAADEAGDGVALDLRAQRLYVVQFALVDDALDAQGVHGAANVDL